MSLSKTVSSVAWVIDYSLKSGILVFLVPNRAFVDPTRVDDSFIIIRGLYSELVNSHA